MTFQDLLKRVEGAKPETLPALLPELFRGIYEGGFWTPRWKPSS